MRKTALLFISIVSLALGTATLEASTNYWDSNGSLPGAGATPTGTWDLDTFWSTSVAGTSATAGWVQGDTAVFSAGSDATSAYTVSIDGSIQVGGIIFKDGLPTITGGGIQMTNEFEFPISVTNDAIIDSPISDLLATTGIKKTGPGKLSLRAANFYGGGGGTNTVLEGILSAGGPVAIGSSTITVVSNGATLEMATSQGAGYDAILNGFGVTNGGALRGTSGSPSWGGNVLLGSDTRINWDGGGTWNWNNPYSFIDGTVGNYNLTIGGNGGTVRFNSGANAGNRAVKLGTGKVIKDGTSRAQFENPTICSAVDLNGGTIYPRNISSIGQGNIYAGPFAGGFDALFVNCTMGQPLILAAGANVVLYCNLNIALNVSYDFTWTGVISGAGGMSTRTTGTGKAYLNAHNTYTGNTTIYGGSTPGTLVLGANGSIANSAVIDVQTNAVFNVSAVTGGFVLGAGQTLKGDGMVIGNVQASGTLAPGNYVGTLTLNDGLALAAGVKVAIDIDKSVSPANDLISVLGTLSNAGSGTVVVSTHGATPLLAGESYQIFSQPVPNGNALTVVSAMGDVIWANNLQANGSITVVKAAPTLVTIAGTGPTSYTLGGVGGANLTYNVYAYTNVGAPLVNWWVIGTANANGSGVISFVDTHATNGQRFYRFGW